MTLQDALFNWLQIRIVSEARPDDLSAKETLDFFGLILTEDHKLNNLKVTDSDETKISISYEHEGKNEVQTFHRERAVQLLKEIEENPKYNS